MSEWGHNGAAVLLQTPHTIQACQVGNPANSRTSSCKQHGCQSATRAPTAPMDDMPCSTTHPA